MKLKTLSLVGLLILSCSCCMADRWNVVDAGAVGDGKMDCTAIFQKVLDDARAAGNAIVHVPAGKYRINGNLVIPSGVTLKGTFTTPACPWSTEMEDLYGSVLLAYAGRGSNEGKPFIKLGGSSAAIQGFAIVYPEWKQTDVPPVPYPPCIMADGAVNVAIMDCNILNAYEAIRLVRAARHLVRNVHGYPIWRGLYADEIYDIGRIENVQFCPLGTVYRQEDPYCKWINTHGTAFEFARSDWHYVINTFCFGYGVGYKFSQSPAGVCNGNFLGIGADCCIRPIMVENASSFGLLITNGEFVGRWGSDDSVGIEIGEKCEGNISLNNCTFWGPIEKCVWMRGDKAQFTASSCNFQNWAHANPNSPAIDVDAGRVILQGNVFALEKPHVDIAKNVRSAIVMGNQASGGLIVKNEAGNRTVNMGNEQPRVVWTNAAKANYRIDIGSEGDGRYVKNWEGGEGAGEWGNAGTKRWAKPNAQFILPVLPGKAYNFTIDVHVPEHAIQPNAGIYLGETLVAKFTKPGQSVLTGKIPASKDNEIVLDVKCKNWVPKLVEPGSTDERQLGIAVRSITLQEAGSKPKQIFDANTGEWVD